MRRLFNTTGEVLRALWGTSIKTPAFKRRAIVKYFDKQDTSKTLFEAARYNDMMPDVTML